MLDLMTSYTTQWQQYVCMVVVRPKQSQGRFSTRVRQGNEELSFVEEFRYLGHVVTADCGDDKDIKNNLGGKMLLAVCWSGSSHLHLYTDAKIQFFKLLPNLWMCSLASFLSKLYYKTYVLLTSLTYTCKRLINVPRLDMKWVFASANNPHKFYIRLKFGIRIRGCCRWNLRIDILIRTLSAINIRICTL